MKKVLISLLVMPMLLLTGCGQLLEAVEQAKKTEEKKAEEKPKEEAKTETPAATSPAPSTPPTQDPQLANGDRIVTIDGVKVVTDQRKWTYRTMSTGQYMIAPNGSPEGKELIMLVVQNVPMPRMDDKATRDEFVRGFINGASSNNKNVDVKLVPIRGSANDYLYGLRMVKYGSAIDGYVRMLGNGQKSVSVIYMCGKKLPVEDMKKWEERVSQATLGAGDAF